MLDWINERLALLSNNNKNVIFYPDNLEKLNRRIQKTTIDPTYYSPHTRHYMANQDEITHLIEQIKSLELELTKQESMSERVVVRKDINELKNKVNKLVREITE